MTPDERQLIKGLFDRMRGFGPVEKDRDAEALINDSVRQIPDATYMLVQSVLALFPAPPPGVIIARDVEARLPAVLADRDQILQVLLNLVRNALDAMPKGGTVVVRAHRAGAAVAFSVSDSGPGIRPEDRPRIFEPYFTTKEGGTGLGLAIAQRIAEEHGGALELSPPAAGGATFTLTLPVTA